MCDHMSTCITWICVLYQAEKRKTLLDHENEKLRELDVQFEKEYESWKSQLRPRKQVIRHLVRYYKSNERYYVVLVKLNVKW